MYVYSKIVYLSYALTCVYVGDYSGSVPGPAERLHHPVPGSYQARGSPARCASSGGGHVSCPTGPLCPGQSQPLPDLY